ncbi:hypothetical protein AHAS_Ahas20G0255200 [Arachis hypogaea]
MLVGRNLAPFVSYFTRLPSLYRMPGVLHYSRLAFLPAVVLSNGCYEQGIVKDDESRSPDAQRNVSKEDDQEIEAKNSVGRMLDDDEETYDYVSQVLVVFDGERRVFGVVVELGLEDVVDIVGVGGDVVIEDVKVDAFGATRVTVTPWLDLGAEKEEGKNGKEDYEGEEGEYEC